MNEAMTNSLVAMEQQRELHQPRTAVEAIVATRSKVTRPPLFQHNLKALTATLCSVCQQLSPPEITCYIAP